MVPWLSKFLKGLTVMFLSIASVTHQEAFGNNLLDSYQWHKEVSKIFNKSRNEEGYIFRVDEKKDSYQIFCYSQNKPFDTSVIKWKSILVSEKFFQESFYTFDLKAIPVYNIPMINGRGKRTALMSRTDLENWFLKKAESCGFSVDIEDLEIQTPQTKSFNKKGVIGKHTCVVFRGVLTVKDQTKFFDSVKNGIGPAKGFGYGFMKLMPC